jgi:hypothetical protein
MNYVIKKRYDEIKKLLEHHQTVSIMGMPGVGISLFLKELAKSNLGLPVYIDVFGLTTLSSEALVKTLSQQLGVATDGLNNLEMLEACIKALEKLTKSKQNIIIYFAGFDQLVNAIDSDFLQHLQALSRSCNGRVKLIFGLCISLKKLIPDTYFDSGLRLFGNKYYLGQYSKQELLYFLSQYGPADWQSVPDLDKKIELSGGHFQLLLLLLSSKPEISDMQDESINLLFKNLYQLLLGPQRTILRQVAQGKKGTVMDEYLEGIGMVRNNELFSPLFTNYLRDHHQGQLPVKEYRLFLLLKKNLGQVVPKQKIMDVVWQGEIVSEWTLNALVYRLRKHPLFLSKGFVVENHKKVGYKLVKR